MPGFLLPDSAAPGSLLLGLSGGLDSSVLLHQLANRLPATATSLRAHHVHHDLQTQADDWADHCQRFCDQLGIPLQIARVQVDRTQGIGLEAAARAARYQAFRAAMDEHTILVTAHHQDDQAETFLLRALRASGPDGLAAMRVWRALQPGWHWRPLLDTSRTQLLAYARQHELSWIEDPSNGHLEHDRNFLRQRILPLLRERWPHADEALARSAGLSAQAVDLLSQDDAKALALARTAAPCVLRLSALRGLPASRRARVLRRWVDEQGFAPLPAQGIHQLEGSLLHAAADSDACFEWEDAVIKPWRDLLHLGRQTDGLPADWQTTWDGHMPLRLPNGDQLQMDADQPLPFQARVSGRQGGEHLRLPGRDHHHALKKLLQEHGLPPWERERLPLLWSADGELQAAGDLFFSAGFDQWMRENGTRLRWLNQHR